MLAKGGNRGNVVCYTRSNIFQDRYRSNSTCRFKYGRIYDILRAVQNSLTIFCNTESKIKFLESKLFYKYNKIAMYIWLDLYEMHPEIKGGTTLLKNVKNNPKYSFFTFTWQMDPFETIKFGEFKYIFLNGSQITIF